MRIVVPKESTEDRTKVIALKALHSFAETLPSALLEVGSRYVLTLAPSAQHGACDFTRYASHGGHSVCSAKNKRPVYF